MLEETPGFDSPPHHSQIQQHRQQQQLPAPIELNEIGPMIQQGVIQCPVQKKTVTMGARPKDPTQKLQQTELVPPVQGYNRGNMSDPGDNGRDSLPVCDRNPGYHDRTVETVQGSKTVPVNEVARPIFVNHYYAGEQLMPVTSKRLIRLNETDSFMTDGEKGPYPQIITHEPIEHSRDSLTYKPNRIVQRNAEASSTEVALNRGIHSEFREHLQNLLSIPSNTRKDDRQERRESLRSEFVEPSRHLLGKVNIGKSRVEATYQKGSQVPLTGYEHFPQEMQAYPVVREPVKVQPTTNDNNSALLDLLNVQMNLSPPLTPQQPSSTLKKMQTI